MRLQTSHMSPTMDLDSISCLMIDPMMINRSFVQIITYLVRKWKVNKTKIAKQRKAPHHKLRNSRRSLTVRFQPYARCRKDPGAQNIDFCARLSSSTILWYYFTCFMLKQLCPEESPETNKTFSENAFFDRTLVFRRISLKWSRILRLTWGRGGGRRRRWGWRQGWGRRWTGEEEEDHKMIVMRQILSLIYILRARSNCLTWE